MQLAGTDLRILRVFCAVVRHGGFSAAQAELNINQSTISNHISSLESRLGVKLCQRGRGGFQLTEKGEIVLKATLSMLSRLDEFTSEMEALKGQLIGKLKLGVVDCVVTDSNSKISEAISVFKQRANDVFIHIEQDTPQKLQEKILDGILHLGIGSFPHKISGINYEPLYKETHSFYCGKGHHLFGELEHKEIPEGLSDESVVSRSYWPDQFQKGLGFKNIAASVYEIEPQLILILSGQYIGLLPDHFAKKWVEQGELYKLNSHKTPYVCTFDLAIKNGYKKTQVLNTFLQDLRAICQLDD